MKKLSKLALLIVLVAGLADWMLRRTLATGTNFDFEGSPRPVLSALKISSSQKPQLAAAASGMISMLAVAGSEDRQRLVYSMSHDGGDSFSRPVNVSSEDAWVSAHGENTPSLALSSTVVYAAWQQKPASGPSQIMFARSLNMGRSFETPVAVTDKSQPSFNGFSTMKAAPNGDIYAVWLDGRDTATPAGTFGVYLAKSTDKGASFSPNMRIALGACPCCRPALTFGPKGEVYASWRKVFPGDVRDMVVAVSTDGGAAFSEPVRAGNDDWVLHACPDSGPSMVFASGKLYVAWFSEGKPGPGIRVAVSADGGRSFSRPEIVSSGVADANHPQLAVAEAGRVELVFQGRRNSSRGEQWNRVQVFTSEIGAEGRASSPQALPIAGQSASYPTVVAAGAGRLFVAWTESAPDSHQVQLCRGRQK